MVKIKENYEEFFRRGLIKIIGPMAYGAQTSIAKSAGIVPQQINAILKGRRYGSEDVKRKISDALGQTYEEMIALGKGGSADPPGTSGMKCAEGKALEKRPVEVQMERELLRMAKFVLRSGTAEGAALHANIVAFYSSLTRQMTPVARGGAKSPPRRGP